jgi:outer membrane receptor protein involved in Fe transport
LNALTAGDSVLVVTESDPEEREESTSDTRNFHFWARLDNAWTTKLSSSTVLSNSNFRNSRVATIQFPEVLLAEVVDIRKVDSLAVRQDWRYEASDTHILQWGVEAEQYRAVYDYQAEADYFGFKAAFAGQPGSVARSITTNPNGNSYGVYVSDRWQLGKNTIAEFGLRWDKQTYTQIPSDNQVSPRFSLLHSFNKNLDLRLSWGRYSQSQGIQELQVEDGIDNFFPAQRSDHLIAGFQYRFRDFYSLRVEAFHKNFSRLKPRFENLHDTLALIPELQPDRVMVAPESSTAFGLELSVDYRGPGQLYWWGSYTLARATDRELGRSVPRSWDQRHSFQAGLGWSNGPWEIGIAAAYRTGWPITGLDLEVHGDEEFTLTPGPRNTLRLGNFSSIDLRIGREFDVKRGKLTAFFELSNALDSKNPCCVDYDTTEGPNNEIIIDKSIDNWLPLLPAVGVLWEF